MNVLEIVARRATVTVLSGFLPAVFFLRLDSAHAQEIRQTASTTQQQFTEAPKPSRIQEEIRADGLAADKRYSEAIEVYKELLRSYPRDAVLLNKTGIAYHQEQNFREAKRYYQRALRADPNYANAENNLGTIDYQRKSYKKAIGEYKKAIALDDSVGSFYSNLGYAYFSIKQYDPAITAFRKAIQLDPTLFEHHSQTGTVLLERTVEERAKFFYFLAKSYAQSGDAEHCVEYLRKSRDEGYKQVADAKTDPAFAGVRSNPAVKEFLDSLVPAEAKQSS